MVLIIYASPNPKGNTATILINVETLLKKRNEKYEVLDLYKMKYNPVLNVNELYTIGNRKISAQNKKIQKKITKETKLIVIFPIWWNSVPAILKGFLDKVFTAGYGFRYKGVVMGVGIPEGLLKGKKAVVFLNSGVQVFLSKIFQGGRAGKIVAKDTLGFCGIKCKTFQTGKGTKPDKNKKLVIKKTVNKGLNWLFR